MLFPLPSAPACSALLASMTLHTRVRYVGLGDATGGAELFYYFVESERSPSTDPLLLWHSGGPGCSAFSALAFQIGPLKFVERRYDGTLPQLVRNPYSLTQVRVRSYFFFSIYNIFTRPSSRGCYLMNHLIERHQVASIIFVDSPVGTGFSYARDPKGYNVGDISASLQVLTFLRKVGEHNKLSIDWRTEDENTYWACMLLKFCLYSGLMITQGIFQILSTLAETRMPGRWLLLLRSMFQKVPFVLRYQFPSFPGRFIVLTNTVPCSRYWRNAVSTYQPQGT